MAYFRRSRGLPVSMLAIAPLLIIYETGLWISGASEVNGAEAMLRRLFMLLGPETGPFAWRAALGAAFGIAFFFALRQRLPIHKDVPLVALEGLGFGLLLGPIAIALQHKLDAFLMVAHPVDADFRSQWLQVTLSVGAGVYEEILFRLILLSFIFFVASRASATAGASHYGAAGIAIVLSSAIFSVFHYWPFGEPFAWRTFAFRTIAGAVLGVIFIFRGLGVAAWSHAAYDILLILT